MGLSFKAKTIILLLTLMFIFMAVTGWISYLVSNNVIMNGLQQSNHVELSMHIDSLEDAIDKSKEKFRLFMDDLQFQFDINLQDQISLRSNRDNINSQFRTFLYTNPEFGSLFVYRNGLMVGTSLENEILSFVEHPAALQEPELAADVFLQWFKDGFHYDNNRIFRDNIVYVPLRDDMYIVGFLDWEKLLQQNKLAVQVMNSRLQIIAGQWQDSPEEQAALLQYAGSHALEPGSFVSFRESRYLISAMKHENGLVYVGIRDLQDINAHMIRIVKKLLGIGLAVYVLFAGIAQLAAGTMVKPIYQFIQMLREVKGYEDHRKFGTYIAAYSGHASVYLKIFLYFAMITIPVLCMVTASFYYFEKVVQSNTRQDYLGILKQTAAGIEQDLSAYDDYMRYLSLNREFQQALLTAKTNTREETVKSFSELLLRKGIVNQNISYVNIKDADGQSVFSNPSHLQNESRHPVVRRTQDIRYLSHTTDKTNAFAYMGSLEFEIKDIFVKTPKVVEDKSISWFATSTKDGMQWISSTVNGYNASAAARHIEQFRQSESDAIYVDTDGHPALFAMLPIDKGAWSLGFYVPSSWEQHKYLLVLLYIVELVFMLAIVVIASNLLGRRMTAPIRRTIRFMEEYRQGQTSKLDGSGYDYEFAVLASQFNRMLTRLEAISQDLRAKEYENFEMEKRMNKLLLKALQSQINPHFLQNIFSSILLLLKSGQTEPASSMVVATARFLKTGLYGTNELVLLREEVEHVRHYLNIQSIRFERQLAWNIAIDEAFHAAKVPKFMLQPLAENAIHHGMGNHPLLTLSITCIRDGDRLVLTVADDGLGMDKHQLHTAIANMYNRSQTEHYGLSNVNERILLEFGEGYGLRLNSSPGSGTSVHIILPFLEGDLP